VLGLSLALAGCGANFEAQTYQTRTVADGTNADVGAIAIRNLTLLAPEDGQAHSAGDDAEVRLTLTNDGPEDDRLVEVTTPAADAVELQDGGGEVDAVELPRLGTTGSTVTLQLTGLTEDLVPGRYVEMTLRFERNGEVTVSVPVATTGEFEEREHSENFHQIGEEH
jgi:copper(I)-binding protein